REPVFLRELGRASLGRPGAGHGVVVQVDAVDHAAGFPHHRVRPREVVAGGPGGDAERAAAAEELGVALVDVDVLRGRHGTAASPALVAHAPEADAVRLRVSVPRTLVTERAPLWGAQVLPPLRHLLHGAAAHVADDERLGAEALDQLHVFVRAEAIVLGHAAPDRVHDGGPLGPDAVAPVVVVREAAARPAQVGDLDPLQRLDDVVAQVPLPRARLGPEAIVDVAPKVFTEVAVDVTADGGLAEVRVDDQPDRRLR